MTDLGWISFQLFLLFWKYKQRNAFSIVLCVLASSYLPTLVSADRSAFVEIQPENSHWNKFNGLDHSDVQQLKGSYATIGNVRYVEGKLFSLVKDKCGTNDKKQLGSEPQTDWIAVLDYSEFEQESGTNATHDCHSVIERVKTAMMFGASAIIILALNPRIIKELDIAQLFVKPVILIQEVENVTTLLTALARNWPH